MTGKWTVQHSDEFSPEYVRYSEEIQDEILAISEILEERGPHVGRPRVDTLKGSKYPNMKEMRFDAEGGVWRLAFIFDTERSAILLVAGDKSGGSEKTFYKRLIAKADTRYAAHLDRLAGAKLDRKKQEKTNGPNTRRGDG